MATMKTQRNLKETLETSLWAEKNVKYVIKPNIPAFSEKNVLNGIINYDVAKNILTLTPQTDFKSSLYENKAPWPVKITSIMPDQDANYVMSVAPAESKNLSFNLKTRIEPSISHYNSTLLDKKTIKKGCDITLDQKKGKFILAFSDSLPVGAILSTPTA